MLTGNALIMIALLLLISEPIDQAGRLNAVLTNCLFATAREARSRLESTLQFQTSLGRSCQAVEASARRVAISILINRGATRDAAGERMGQVLRNGREVVLRAYALGRGAD